MRWIDDVLDRARRRSALAVRRAVGLTQQPPARCDDPELAYSDVRGVTRVVQGDLPSMLVGGIGSLFFQMLHPHAMAGVAEHSRYQDDPLSRLRQTANFIGATTFGSNDDARRAIDRVLAVHRRVHGVADDGLAYDANDPHLLLWVHCAEIAMFLAGYQRFGPRPLSDEQADDYVRETARLARDLGVLEAPKSAAELSATLDRFRPELRLSADGVAAREFLTNRVMTTRTQRAIYRLVVLSAWSLLAPWAQHLLGVHPSRGADRLFVRPLTRVLARAVRLALPRPRHVVRVSPPSTTTT